MKKNNWQLVLTLTFCFLILFLFVKNVSSKNQAEAQAVKLADDLSKVNILNAYVMQQLEVAQLENDNESKTPLDTIQIFKIQDGKPQPFKSFKDFLGEGKRKLIIRYSEIGCNSCSDSTVLALRKNPEVTKYFDVVFLVDFSNEDAYFKWKKISEIDYPMYWAYKHSLPFNVEEQNQSYMFTADKDLRFSNFFIPNSMYPRFIDAYLENLSRKFI